MINVNKKAFLYYKNDNVILPFATVKENNYTFKEVSELLNISINEVFAQFNDMVASNDYCLYF